MSLHSFDPEIAGMVGINAAVIYQNLLFWAEKNKANQRHIKDGYVWTYNSRRAFSELFPYLSESQVKTAINKLVDCGLVVKGEYNNAMYDRTNWYSPAITADWVDGTIGQKSPMDRSKITNGLVKNRQPIPDSKPDGKPDKNTSLREDTFSVSVGEIKDIWKEGLEALCTLGLSERTARSQLGKWSKRNGRDDIAEAIRQAVDAGTGDPVPYITTILSPKARATGITQEDLDRISSQPRKVYTWN